jgi:hypothetical protein
MTETARSAGHFYPSDHRTFGLRQIMIRMISSECSNWQFCLGFYLFIYLLIYLLIYLFDYILISGHDSADFFEWGKQAWLLVDKYVEKRKEREVLQRTQILIALMVQSKSVHYGAESEQTYREHVTKAHST